MGETTAITWTDHTFNPWWGCARVSPGCQHCYAETFSHRLGLDLWGKGSARRRFGDKHWDEPLKWNDAAEKAGRPALVFCASMADVFEDREDHHDDRARLWELIRLTPHLEWQLLTKRPENVLSMVPRPWLIGGWPANAWIGTTVEDQQRADERIPHLLNIPACVRFLSCEPLLGHVELPWAALNCDHDSGTGLDDIPLGATGNRWRCDSCGQVQLEVDDPEGTTWVSTIPRGVDRRVRYDTLQPGRLIDWVIVGGESGPGARPMHPDWARDIRDQCVDAGIPFFFKQWGEYRPLAGNECAFAGDVWPAGTYTTMCRKVGKKAAGQELDGHHHEDFPARAQR